MYGQQLPGRIYLDTSFCVRAVIAGTPRHNAMSALCTRLGQNASRVYFSQILWPEFAQAMVNLVEAPRSRIAPQLWNQFNLGRWNDPDPRVRAPVRQQWIRRGARQLNALLTTF